MNNFIESVGIEGYEVVEENGKFTFNMDEVTNLKVWTATTSIISVTGFVVCLLISMFL